jgi:hypothetical protein
MTTPATVFGVPLEPGERIIYFRRDDPGWQKPFLIVIGVLTLFVFLGIFILYAGITADTVVYVITTKRFLVIEGLKRPKAEFIRHGRVERLTKKVAGSIIKWVTLEDGATLLQWQAAVNARDMPALLEKYVRDPSAAEAAPSVEFEPMPGPRIKAAS